MRVSIPAARAWRLLACAVLVAALDAAAGLEPERALAASRAAIGSTPDPAMRFTATDGRGLELGSLRGRPLVVSFVYTACSQVCPATTKGLAKAVREARAVVGADAFNVASIGFDIPADNPVSMRAFARQHGIDDSRWLFLTPETGVPRRLAEGFGFAFEPAAGGYEHLAQVTVLDAGGRVRAQVYGDSFDPRMLVGPLRGLALGETVEAAPLGLLDRARLLCTVYDPLTGKYRLDYALFIELGVGLFVLGSILAFLVRERRRARRAC